MMGTPVDPEVIAAVRNAAQLCEKLGHSVEEARPKLDVAAIGKAVGFPPLFTDLLSGRPERGAN